ncbi:hypothetical protein QWY82_10185 [Simiduia curdlanivorans]|uniref:Uncharacterized protein n=1 Tax=Simiduia curdlanivorans TaxID=1492769 RepID=A0ABV8V1A5_9GAMM|nr:hypothetical protein [Simiduia curdlanivorans]MDN3639178.1 hypothetical protein [Simiduia curdlanivorans]
MQYTKPMIDLIYEVRRRVSSELKPDIKMANPDVLHILADYAQHSKDAIAKALIKELLSLAGAPRSMLLAEQQAISTAAEIPELVAKPIVRVYRGQVMLSPAPEPRPETTPKSTQRIYRGQLVT